MGRISAHLHALVKVEQSLALAFPGGHLVLAEDPMLAGTRIGHESVSESIHAESIVARLGTRETHHGQEEAQQGTGIETP